MTQYTLFKEILLRTKKRRFYH